MVNIGNCKKISKKTLKKMVFLGSSGGRGQSPVERGYFPSICLFVRSSIVTSVRPSVCPPSAGPQTPPAGPQTPPVGPQSPPAGPQSPPAGSQSPPAGPQTPPAGPQTPPAGPQTPPASPQTPPASLKTCLVVPNTPQLTLKPHSTGLRILPGLPAGSDPSGWSADLSS